MLSGEPGVLERIYDDDECEAFLLVDHDRQQALVSCHLEGYASKSDFLRQMRRSWRGWKLRLVSSLKQAETYLKRHDFELDDNEPIELEVRFDIEDPGPQGHARAGAPIALGSSLEGPASPYLHSSQIR